VVDTIKAIEKEYPGLKQHQMVKSNKKIVAGTEYYDTNNDLQVRGSENEIKNYLCRQSQRYKGRPHFQHIEEFASFPSHPKRLTENCLGQSKGSWKVMGQLRSLRDDDRYRWICKQQGCRGCFTNPRGFNLLVINVGRTKQGSLFQLLKYGEPGNLAVCLTLS
jgi:hypothetical protein